METPSHGKKVIREADVFMPPSSGPPSSNMSSSSTGVDMRPAPKVQVDRQDVAADEVQRMDELVFFLKSTHKRTVK